MLEISTLIRYSHRGANFFPEKLDTKFDLHRGANFFMRNWTQSSIYTEVRTFFWEIGHKVRFTQRCEPFLGRFKQKFWDRTLRTLHWRVTRDLHRGANFFLSNVGKSSEIWLWEHLCWGFQRVSRILHRGANLFLTILAESSHLCVNRSLEVKFTRRCEPFLGIFCWKFAPLCK